MTEHYLSDALWQAIAPVLPGKIGDPGCSGRDNRAFIEGVLWIARTGSPWRDLPVQYGKWYTTYTRFNRWAKKDVWPEVIAALTCPYTQRLDSRDAPDRDRVLDMLQAAGRQVSDQHRVAS